jgi:tRNA dimethylallyltransferase
MPGSDATLRSDITNEARERSWSALHADLALVDPDAAARIHATDAQRIQRALEVWRGTGRPISAWQQDASRARFPNRVLKLILAPRDRSVLHARIEQRFDAMLAAGFLDEVSTLRALPPLQSHPAPLDLPALRAVGYRQAWEHLDGVTSASEFRERAVAATRQLAKRQFTWLRREYDARWFDPAEDEHELERALALFLGASPT